MADLASEALAESMTDNDTDVSTGGGGHADNDAEAMSSNDATGDVAVAGGAGGAGGAGTATGGASGAATGGAATGGEATGGTNTGGEGGNASADGGQGGNAGSWGSGNGDDGYVTGESYASAAAQVETAAFNQSIVMGANVLGNTVDMNVVGGSFSSNYTGDDSDGM